MKNPFVSPSRPILTICVEGTTSPPIAMNNALTKPAISIQLNATGKISIGLRIKSRERTTAKLKICERMNPTKDSNMPGITSLLADD